jgi:maltose alpha-D-glucosyltransferase/alpha-amylase
MSFPQWYKNAIFYEVYVRAFYDSNGDGHGDLQGLTKKLGYLKDLGVDCLWLLPIYSSPLMDDGYDISDFTNLHPDYGMVEDFKHLLIRAHQLDLRVITDLVLNHTSDLHPWFQAARASRNSPYRNYYIWSDDDQRYSGARIIFTDTEKSNWTWDPLAGQYYWHRFYACQPDLNYDNPRVQAEIFDIMKFWLDLGVDGFRADAVPYLFEREGTNCENLPETHTYLKSLRHFVDENYPGRILLCEANQWMQDVRAYFGEGDEFHMAFQFPLMPRIFMALKQGRHLSMTRVLAQTPPIPTTFLRNHDELTLEMVTPEEREWMWQEYAPDPRMRLNLGIRRRLAPLLDNDQNKIELAYALLFSLPGVPIIYYGDEIGMGDDINLPDRNGVRTPMQWDSSVNAGFSSAAKLYAPVISSYPYSPQFTNVETQKSDPASLWHAIQKMVSARKSHVAFGMGEYIQLDCGQEAAFIFHRKYQREQILVINNLSDQPLTVALPLHDLPQEVTNILTQQIFSFKNSGGQIKLNPYEYLWLTWADKI